MHKHVLVVTPLIAPGGGPPGYVYNLMRGIEELSEAGELKNKFEFFGRLSKKRYKATGDGFRPRSILSSIVQFLSKWGLNPPRSRRIANARKAIENADVVVYQGYQDAQLVIYAHFRGTHTVYMPHSPSIMADEVEMVCRLNNRVLEQEFYNRIRDNEAQLISNSDTVAFPSKGAASHYESAFSELLGTKHIVYIKSGVSINSGGDGYSSFERRKSNEIRVAFAGRYVSHKGYDLFCDAAELVCMTTPGVEFYSFGDGPIKRDSAHVTRMGWRSDVFNFLKDVDIVAVPNRIAYYDLLPLECAAFGKPLVMTAVGGSNDQLRDLPDSVACHDICAGELASSIQVAIEKLRKDSSWGRRNKQAYEKNFTISEFARRWDSVIEMIVSDR